MFDKKGQISLEYLVIFTLAFTLLAAMTLPMLQDSLVQGKKVKAVSEAKVNLDKIAGAIRVVQIEGINATLTTHIHSSHENWILTVNSQYVQPEYEWHTFAYWLGWDEQVDRPDQLVKMTPTYRNKYWGSVVIEGFWIGNRTIDGVLNADYVTLDGVGEGTWEIIVVNDLDTKGKIVIGGLLITTPVQNKTITIHVGPPGSS